MAVKNKIIMKLMSNEENVAISRVAAAAFAAQTDITLGELEDIKVAISEAVSNAMIHGYEGGEGIIEFTMSLFEGNLEFVIADFGVGIENIALARQPAYSTDPERMGLGFVFMESFMDELVVQSKLGEGTTVTMIKRCDANRVH